MALPTHEAMPVFLKALEEFLCSPDLPRLQVMGFPLVIRKAEDRFYLNLRDVKAVPCDKAAAD